ncbi:hypothetical protein ACFWTC_21835 [Streptomyces sp. NPDC058619]|uniref:hypothetical protein n=1 Tax=unclassified Streptomyces TaxID=2593676 RepID=UPI0036622528
MDHRHLRPGAQRNLVTTATLGDRLGRKTLLLAGFVLFGVASVLAAIAGQAGAVSETSYELGVGLGVALLGSIHGAGEHAETLPDAEGALITTAYVSIGIAAAVLVLAVWMVPGSFKATGSGHSARDTRVTRLTGSRRKARTACRPAAPCPPAGTG